MLASQYRGNDGGEGRDEFGGEDIHDVLNLIKMAKSLPFIDSSKIVMIGFSRGGMMTYLAIKHGAQIKAAAVAGGITDLGQMYNDRDQDMKNVIKEHPEVAKELYSYFVKFLKDANVAEELTRPRLTLNF